MGGRIERISAKNKKKANERIIYALDFTSLVLNIQTDTIWIYLS